MLEELVSRWKSLLAFLALVYQRSKSSHIISRGLESSLWGRLETACMGEIGGGIWRIHLAIGAFIPLLMRPFGVVIPTFSARLNYPIPSRVARVGAWG
jgi:hypothetical protein